ncbi:hypothetical protein ALC57_03891 [Trachymyrmex cornetzi]|uniref:Uncharacterized protein n=1 Tax=Trachymyrmex cornetzi TaxID=471704 RepID=A0A151JLN2_9HYME|nr:hypothetical protein ALC57_03891 [Trachymyrmex cornetzi]
MKKALYTAYIHCIYALSDPTCHVRTYTFIHIHSYIYIHTYTFIHTRSYISMSKSTVLNIFNPECCVNRLISPLTAMTDNIDKKFSRLLAVASTVTKSANMLKTMYDNESFDRNDILNCELIALVFGEQ